MKNVMYWVFFTLCIGGLACLTVWKYFWITLIYSSELRLLSWSLIQCKNELQYCWDEQIEMISDHITLVWEQRQNYEEQIMNLGNEIQILENRINQISFEVQEKLPDLLIEWGYQDIEESIFYELMSIVNLREVDIPNMAKEAKSLLKNAWYETEKTDKQLSYDYLKFILQNEVDYVLGNWASTLTPTRPLEFFDCRPGIYSPRYDNIYVALWSIIPMSNRIARYKIQRSGDWRSAEYTVGSWDIDWVKNGRSFLKQWTDRRVRSYFWDHNFEIVECK